MHNASPAELQLAHYLVGNDPQRQAEVIAAIRAHVERENAKLRRGLMLITTGGGTPEERRAFCHSAGIDHADANGIAQAALR